MVKVKLLRTEYNNSEIKQKLKYNVVLSSLIFGLLIIYQKNSTIVKMNKLLL